MNTRRQTRHNRYQKTPIHPTSTKRNRTKKRRGERRRGGKLVGQGAYGCGFYPALRCSTNTESDPTLFSKFMDEEEAEKEMSAVKRVSELDPTQQYSVYPTKSCDLNPENLNIWSENFSKCKILMKKENIRITYPFFRVLQMPRAEMDLQAFCMTLRGSALSQLRPLFEGMRNLFVGLAEFHSHNFYHMDIKSINIVVSNAGQTCRFIDFGLSSEGEFRDNYKVVYFAYPFELQLHGIDFTRIINDDNLKHQIDMYYEKHKPYLMPYNSMYTESGDRVYTINFIKDAVVPVLKNKPTQYFLEKTDIFSLGQVLSTILVITHGFYIKDEEPYFVDQTGEKEVPYSNIFFRFFDQVYERLHLLVLDMTDANPEFRPTVKECLRVYDDFLRAYDAFLLREPAASPHTILGKRSRNNLSPTSPNLAAFSSTTPSFLKD